MQAAIEAERADADVIVMAAAVADFRPKRGRRRARSRRTTACPRSSSSRRPTSSPASAPRKRPGQMLVGFAAETADLLANATAKLRAQAPRPDRRQRRQPPPASASSTTPTPSRCCGRTRDPVTVDLRRQARDRRGRPRRVVEIRDRPARDPPSPTTTRAAGAPREPVDLHLRERHRGPSRQDGRPGQRRRARRHPRRGPERPRRLRDAADHGPVRRRRRDHDDGLRRHPQAGPRDDQLDRLRQRRSTASTATRAASSSVDRRAEPRTSPRASTPARSCAAARPARTSSTPRAPATRG